MLHNIAPLEKGIPGYESARNLRSEGKHEGIFASATQLISVIEILRRA
jgi:hypothetical protein